MRKIIHYALHQPLFIVLGTVLFAMAGLFAWALSGEHYSWIKIAGAGVTLAGVALAQYAGQIKWRLR